MLTNICAEIKNYFLRDDSRHEGSYDIEDGSITLPFMKAGQYFRIVGSALNDGVYKYPVDGNIYNLADETFTGEIWAMYVPPAFEKLVVEIDAWTKANAAAINSPYASESFGGYSYSKDSGGGVTWQKHFAKQLKAYRRLHVL